MFTGLVETTLAVLSLEPKGSGGFGARLRLPQPEFAPDLPPWEPELGESLSISGCCLSLAALEPDGALIFDLSAETLERTWFRDARPGRAVNLERSVRLADRLGGHLVSGHVDGRGEIVGIEDPGDGGRLFTFEVEPGFERYLIEKGSVAVDGISLTVVEPQGRRFGVAVIPETLARTSLGTASVGQSVHLEADQIGKWVERLLEWRSAGR